ncbi:zinc finger, CCHC-type containing protein [Tanacetum coccineum]
MTTSVGNNSVFRSFFEKQKLTGPNFIDWYRQLRLVLSTEDKENYLEHPIPKAHVAPPGQQVPFAAIAAHATWVKGQKEVVVLMLLTMDLDIQRNLAHLDRERILHVQVGGSMGKTVNELHAMLKLHEDTLPKKVAAPALHAIRAGKVQKNNNRKSSKAAKGVQGKGKGKKAYANAEPSYAPKPKIPPPPKKDNPAKDAICHHCGCGTHICNTTQGLRGSKKLNPRALSLYMGNGQRAAVEAIGNYHLCLLSGLVIVLNNCHYAPSITRGIIFVSRLYEDSFINRFELNNAISVSKNNVVYFTTIPRDGIYEIEMSCSNTNDSDSSILRKKKEEAQQKKFLENLKQLHINLPFIEALAQMPKYAKFLKGLLTNKARLEEACTITMNERCSAVLLNKLPSKEKDPGSFTIPCDIGQLHINNALADLGASISLMPYTMYEKLGLGEPKATRMSLELADRSIQYPRGIIENVLIKVDKFILPIDFVILDMPEDSRVPIILGRPFLATARAMIDVFNKKITLRVGDNEVIFDVDQSIKRPSTKDGECYGIDDCLKPLSQEFLDHLKEHGIIAHRAPPYTPQNNGVSERRNRTLLDMVQSMMSQTALPKSFWDYALETATRILNMVPTKKVDKTSYEI